MAVRALVCMVRFCGRVSKKKDFVGENSKAKARIGPDSAGMIGSVLVPGGNKFFGLKLKLPAPCVLRNPLSINMVQIGAMVVGNEHANRWMKRHDVYFLYLHTCKYAKRQYK